LAENAKCQRNIWCFASNIGLTIEQILLALHPKSVDFRTPLLQIRQRAVAKSFAFREVFYCQRSPVPARGGTTPKCA
jgi:hypothetical protein